MTVRIAQQVIRVVERELACGYSYREAIDRAGADLGISPEKVCKAIGWLSANY